MKEFVFLSVKRRQLKIGLSKERSRVDVPILRRENICIYYASFSVMLIGRWSLKPFRLKSLLFGLEKRIAFL